jgi:hypothetical protein
MRVHFKLGAVSETRTRVCGLEDRGTCRCTITAKSPQRYGLIVGDPDDWLSEGDSNPIHSRLQRPLACQLADPRVTHVWLPARDSNPHQHVQSVRSSQLNEPGITQNVGSESRIRTDVSLFNKQPLYDRSHKPTASTPLSA